ncbi:MAG: GntR family transcriptional regulator [Clostridia bacterium]|nr:GntR family transcriptional regulator [Clostridia bacterium]
MLINKNSSEPVYAQIINQYKRLIATSALKPNDQLPSVRNLSYEMGINPNTLQKAFSQLEITGICYSVPGKGRFVSEQALDIIRADAETYFDNLRKIIAELAMCSIDLEQIILRAREYYGEAMKK